MNHKLLKGKLGSRSGVTLVELLVVILIVTILAVTLLPVFKKFVVESQYASEALPLIGHVRTQIGLYQYEHNTLPGKSGVIHTYTVAAGDGGAARLYKATYSDGEGENATTTQVGVDLVTFELDDDIQGKSTKGILEELDMASDSLTGNRLKPTHFQYVNLGSKGGSYAYAVGVFGDGDGLPQATGYAVFEANVAGIPSQGGSDVGAKVVGTWKNYTGAGVTEDQIVFHPTSGGTDNHCQLHSGLLTLESLTDLNSALDAMVKWKFTN